MTSTAEPHLLRVLAHIDGSDVEEWSDGTIRFLANADIDDDGPGKRVVHDPAHQDTTSLRHNGAYIDSAAVPGAVIPGSIINLVSGIFLGCLVTVNGVPMVCYDVGPRTKLGEVSIAGAELLGVNPDPLRGGDGRRRYLYIFYPGRAADGFKLQPH